MPKKNYWLDRGDGNGPMYGKYFEDFHIAGQLAYDVGATLRTGPDLVSFLDVRSKANEMMDKHPEWRYGQCMFNALHYMAPDIADIVRATKDDPFHDDTKIEAMFKRFFKERG